ncbi:putative U1 small nuclear ribonucleoprotein 70 kDa like protein [Glarea lozoyensis 74030]|uniref:Putative U1 small nuclear ribonucleoprotein 70 kDa like protein n=1 Tax=Glarea lozoyensis (strain ATCC 74030 / MF5533) TaxID=1104152 RepID=H0ELI2_GLAL7|nr:putative U1 small nuclear ribonucleoprotein 70 kDa like protein [Glarea lozoyensis 74030]
MTDKLPPNLLALFAPRPALRWVAPSDHAPAERKTPNISGIAAFLPQLQEYKETDDYKPTESWLQRKDRLKMEKKQHQEKLLKEGPTGYKPSEDPNIRGDAFKTLIVARLSYEATEQDLESEFGRYGAIERIRIVVDTHQDEKPNKKKKKHRGYAFVVFEREKDMRAALENCDGIRIKDRRIKVDVERGRTVRDWKPRRFGGGKGGRGYTKTIPPRPMGPGSFNGPPGGPGGFRGGGFRGGFDGGRGRGGFRGGFQDRGGYGGGGGGRGGIGYSGGGGFSGGRGGFGGDRGSNGYGAPPNAPAGPGGRVGGPPANDRGAGGFSRGGYGGSGSPERNGNSAPAGGNGGYRGGGGRSYNDRDSIRGSGSNMEPVRPREGGRDGGGYRDRDRDGGYGGRPREDDSRKRQYESNGYEEDPRKLRRY